MMLNYGPCQPTRSYNFPAVENNRSFNPDWFSCNMPDKTTYQRKWLSYSRSAGRAYCLPCIAFSGPHGSHIWTSAGFCDWHNGVRDIQCHESSPEYRTAEIGVHRKERQPLSFVIGSHCDHIVWSQLLCCDRRETVIVIRLQRRQCQSLL